MTKAPANATGDGPTQAGPTGNDGAADSLARDGALRRRPRLFQAAYACEPYYGSEQAVGWNWALEASKTCDVYVACCEDDCRPPIERYLAENGPLPNLHFLFLPHTRAERALIGLSRFVPHLHYAAFRRWHLRAYRRAMELHESIGLDLVQHVNFISFREPGYLWKMPTPMVWGPIGGMQNCPPQFLASLGLRGISEGVRSLINTLQLRFGRRSRRAAAEADALLAANSTSQRLIKQVWGAEAVLLREYGIRRILAEPYEPTPDGMPLRVLWVGRCEPRKGLHLLIDAVARLPGDAAVQLRLIGDGPLRSSLERRARRRGIAERIEWLGRVPHEQTLQHYRWADVFAFPSLRETTGTVMLEAFAHSVPVIALDHQGARDLVTDQSGVRVPVTTPDETVSALADALSRCARDRDEVARLSHGARQRANEFLWHAQGRRMAQVYKQVLGGRLADLSESRDNPVDVQAANETTDAARAPR